MRIFATRVWDFEPTTWPVIIFNREGDRNKLLDEAAAGDRIIFVATQGKEPREEDRGRILGMAEIGRTAVDTVDVVPREKMRPQDFDEHGKIRWPKAIPMLRAWRFPDKPLLKSVLGRQLPFNATSQAVPLTGEEIQAVLALAAEKVEIPCSDVLRRERSFSDSLIAARSPTHGPRPVDWTHTVSHALGSPALTYVFRFGKRDLWKIGWTTDLKTRLSAVNKHVPSEVTGEEWVPALSNQHLTEEAAHAMEQRLLDLLEKHRTRGERVRCTEKDIRSAWSSAFRG